MRALQRLAFEPRSLVEGHLAGRHRSTAIGSSTEFRDYRPYVPGDDLRRVDWRVLARTDRFYLRTHNQETNAACHVFLDSSASMGFGAPASKLDYGSFFVAGLAYLVARRHDAISLHLFDDAVRAFFPAGSTTRHLHTLLRALEANPPGARTSLAVALQHSLGRLRRRGTLVLVSDFFDDAGAIFDALNPYLHRGFEIHLFHVLDPEELQLPERGLATFVDLETNGRVVAHTPSIRKLYEQAMADHIRNLRELARRRHVRYTLARTDAPHIALYDRLIP
ncbi:MAG: hypothetical protein A2X46_03860 [Lentisphaerae bacterium GWF2_57_35]|nr:MAG: hypothetical protein A2X46_03860 [Lentisphaerae bacterium GWF2_57_35]